MKRLLSVTLVITMLFCLSSCNGKTINGRTYRFNTAEAYGREYVLVNRWNKIPDDIDIRLKDIGNGKQVDELIYESLLEMLEDASEDGIELVVVSAYRTLEKQSALYCERVASYVADGYSLKDAEAEASKWVAKPGYSEHHTGLAVDINPASGDSDIAYKWLAENCHNYGFIVRYPEDKSDITGIEYEPWHFRYVGNEAADSIYAKGITLEEYIDSLYNVVEEVWYENNQI